MCNPSFPPPCSSSSSSTFDPLSSSPSSSYYSNDNSYSSRRFRKPSLRSIAGAGTTQQNRRSPLFFDHEDSVHEEKPHYFLDSCFLCKTPLHIGDDIYMYRGDTPFCTEECRQEQIAIDEAQERKNKIKNKLIKSKIENSTVANSKSQSHEIFISVRAAETVVAT